jgi:anti-sigma B factor antagonist
MSADAMPIEAQVEHIGHDLVVHLSGEIDLVTAPALTELCQREVDPSVQRIVIDVSRVGFFDSSGLAALVEIRNRFTPEGARLVLRSPNAALRRLLAITRIEEIVELC